MSYAEIMLLPREEKLRLMEAIWRDISQDEESVESPAWHEQELRATEARIASGQTKLRDWQEVRKTFL
jgi:hypothetical protein